MKLGDGLLLMFLALAVPAVQAAESNDPHAAHRAAAQKEAVAGEDGESQEACEIPADRVHQMRDLLAKAAAATDPESRDALLGEHLNAMQAVLKDLRGTSSGPGAGKQTQAGDTSAPAAERRGSDGGGKRGMGMKMDMMKKHAAVQGRLDALQEVLSQLVEREAIRSAAGGR